MLVLRCTLLRGVFEGARSDDANRAEWPPSWMRLYSALVAVSETNDDALLERLEQVPPPTITCSEVLLPARRRGFVPTNAFDKEGGSTTWPARTNAERSWARAVPRNPLVRYVWPDLELEEGALARLGQLCRRVAYVGRATSPAVVEVGGPSQPLDEEVRLVPHARLAVDERLLEARPMAVPRSGTLDELREAYQVKHVERGAADPWAARDVAEYGLVARRALAGDVVAPYDTLVVFKIEGRYLDGRHAPAAVYALRRTVTERVEASSSGFAAALDRCAFLALPAVGHARSDGHLLGLAVGVPALPSEELRVVARALHSRERELPVVAGALGTLRLCRTSPLEAQREAWGLRPRRWVGPARRWRSALPALLGDPRSDDGAVSQVVSQLRATGLPEPVSLAFDDRPLLPGAVDLRRSELRYRQADLRPLHVSLELPAPVSGPLLLGALMGSGLGLMAPVGEGEA